jgi:tetratricopeptide (TPR) repeat protein
MNYNDRKRKAEELIHQDKYPDALLEYSVLFKENPKDLQNIERSIFLWNRILEGNYDFEPDTAEQYTMRGIAKFYKQEFDNSIDDYDRALNLNKNYHYALKSRAFTLKYLGKIEEAIVDLNNAIRIQPKGEYYDDLAEIYSQLGENKTALYLHQKAIDMSPNEARLWYNFGVNLHESGNLKEALEKYNKAIELWPEYDDAIVNRQLIIDSL